ncbi:MAG: 3-methyl-2-oxobutanoate hydroxymethyltransferase [Mitsuaria chitosanitabida]|uniref:3-methyl-2-oxobutanoate hydroxymethyltransferase n=1 Tax=Roseateles chitosanitabidus TaxID=65048 RepID=UPI001B2A929F|nr:3-methyl-2-oxobutanoate hydroxymethyltransferase [Roseateles chitosanitabidus]MBO9688038.1 3-methyl-2-oxobutanoate hydroxymethyltransferase [Roseateles chitosanitabidus]
MTEPTSPYASAPRPSAAASSTSPERKPVTLQRLLDMHAAGEKIAMLTAYDATFAHAMEDAGVDSILIGDSLGNVVQGLQTTVPVTLDAMVYHTGCVARARQRAWIVADLPYGTYHESPQVAWRNAMQLAQAGAHMIKLEGGGWTTETVRFLTERGIPVCAHLGLTPQTVTALSGYKVQGKDAESAAQIKSHARELVDAGAQMLLLEMVPAALAGELTRELGVPVIGIGAGAECSGQVLVMHDMLGVGGGRKPRFVRDFMQGSASVGEAFARYVADVKSGAFPAPEHTY